MALPIELLTTRALCDEVLAELQIELDDLTLRKANYDRRDDKATARATDIGEELATLDRDVADLTAQLAAMPADSKYRPRREAELRTAVKRRGDLAAAQVTRGPVAAFGAAVDLRQVSAQVAELTTAKAEVTARRAALPA